VTSGGIEATKAKKESKSEGNVRDGLVAVDGSDSEDGLVDLDNGENGEG
jgi:hypothetical protein